jgi:GT2 family glycosyltransferase
MKCSVILVNYNSGTQIEDTVNSITRHNNRLVSSVVIIDNASRDNSLAFLSNFENESFEIKVIINLENRGFAAACNQGALLGQGDYLLFLNPDTILFDNSLSNPLAFMELPENSDVGVVGIQLVDENNIVTRSCARFPTLGMFLAYSTGIIRFPFFKFLSIPMEEWSHDSTETVDHVIGAFYLIRRSLFDALDGFDERFFVYLEDLDLSLRVKKSGWRTVYLSNATAFHAGGGTSHQVKAQRIFYSLRSRILYGFKHFKHWKAWINFSVSLSLEPLCRIILSLSTGSLRNLKQTIKSYYMLYRDIPNILKKYK